MSNGVDGATSNTTFDVFETIGNMKVYLRIRLPEDKNDRRFQKELMKTSIDAGKVFAGNSGNFFIKSVLGKFLDALDFEPKFPFTPVNIASCSSIYLNNNSTCFTAHLQDHKLHMFWSLSACFQDYRGFDGYEGRWENSIAKKLSFPFSCWSYSADKTLTWAEFLNCSNIYLKI